MSDSEEKTEEASDKKLREERQKGNFPKSRNMITAVGIVVGMFSIYSGLSQMNIGFNRLLEGYVLAPTSNYHVLWPSYMSESLDLVISTILFIIGPIILAVIVANIVVNKGVVFAMDQVTPKISRINPVEGFKRIFKKRTIIEFIQSLIIVCFMGVVLFAVLYLALPDIIHMPLCSDGCITSIMDITFSPMLILIILIFIIAALVDLPIQSMLFKEDVKMSKTDVKRERKDMFGDPTIRQQRKQVQEEAKKNTINLKGATWAIGSDRAIVVLRYVKGETPIPTIVDRAAGEKARLMYRHCRARKLPVDNDPRLARMMVLTSQPGTAVNASYLKQAAMSLAKVGII